MKPIIVLFTIILIFKSVSAFGSGLQSPFILGSGARSLGMGRAYVAVANDPTSIFWNPAGLATINQKGFTLFHTNLFLDTNYDFIGYTYPTPNSGVIGLAAFRLDVSDIEVRDKGNNLSGYFKDTQSNYIISYSKELSTYFKRCYPLSGGINLKIATHKSGQYSSTGVGADTGLLYQPFDFIRVGINLQNILEPKIRLKTDETNLPFNLKTGICISFNCSQSLSDKLILALDMDKPKGINPEYHIGLEYSLWKELLSLRVGLDKKDVTAGAGINYKGISLDYCFSKQDLDTTQKFSMTLQFGLTMEQIRQRLRQQSEAEVNKLLEIELAKKEDAQIKEAMTKGKKYLKNKEYKEAIFQFEKILDIKPECKEAEEVLQKIKEQLEMAEFKQQFQTNLFKAREYFSQQNYAMADIEYKQVLKMDAGNLEAVKQLETIKKLTEKGGSTSIGSSISIENQNANIVSQLLPATSTHLPIEKETAKYKAEVYMEEGISDYEAKRYKDAIKNLDKAVSLNKELNQAKDYLQKAQDNFSKERKKVVEKDKALLLKISQSYDRGLEYFKHGKLDKAIKEWEFVHKELPSYEQVESNLIKSYLFNGLDIYNSGNLEESIKIWEKILRIAPQNTKAMRYINRARIEAEKIGQIKAKR